MISVLTLTHDRDEHLVRQQRALVAAPRRSREDLERVVVFMDQADEPTALHEPAGPDRAPGPDRAVLAAGGPTTLHLDTAGLPLGAARNMAAAHARGSVLVFLDVDCIPDPGAVDALARTARATGGLVMADPHYLPPGWDGQGDPALASVPHPSRTNLGTGASPRYEMFWSLAFACTREVFTRLGGFDDAYVGYGAEDTDLAFTARRAGVPFVLDPARVHHQAHAVHRPPLQHLASIVTNARVFRAKWGTWPMEGWLRAFAEAGYVDWSADGLEVLRMPTADEVAAARIADARF